MLGQTFSKLLIITEYELNKAYIAQNLCVNKLLPMMHCNGQCQLAKRLRAEEEQSTKENNSNAAKKIQASEVLYFKQTAHLSIPHLLNTRKTTYPFYLVVDYIAPTASIFRPPAIV